MFNRSCCIEKESKVSIHIYHGEIANCLACLCRILWLAAGRKREAHLARLDIDEESLEFGILKIGSIGDGTEIVEEVL